MKETYNYRLNCEGIIDGTIVSFKASNREAADAEMKHHIEKMTRKGIGFAFVRTGAMTSAQITGAQGGAKSKRTITKKQQASLQKARRIAKQNVPHHLPRKAGTPDADEKGAV